jgi:hypothetical protein
MKKIFLLIIFQLSSIYIYSQYILNNIEIEDLKLLITDYLKNNEDTNWLRGDHMGNKVTNNPILYIRTINNNNVFDCSNKNDLIYFKKENITVYTHEVNFSSFCGNYLYANIFEIDGHTGRLITLKISKQNFKFTIIESKKTINIFGIR